MAVSLYGPSIVMIRFRIPALVLRSPFAGSFSGFAR